MLRDATLAAVATKIFTAARFIWVAFVFVLTRMICLHPAGAYCNNIYSPRWNHIFRFKDRSSDQC